MVSESLWVPSLDRESIIRLPENLKRLVFGEYASKLGHGGIKVVSEYYHVDPGTVSRGKKEYESGIRYNPEGRIRNPGGGAKGIISQYPEISSTILNIVNEACYGDPNTTRKWYQASTRTIAERVKEITGHEISKDTVRRFLEYNDYHRHKEVKVSDIIHITESK